MKKRLTILLLSIVFVLTLVGCKINTNDNNLYNNNQTNTTDSGANSTGITSDTVETTNAKDATGEAKEITNTFTITSENSPNGFSESNGIYTINTAGTYVITGLLNEGSIVVNALETDAVEIDLNGVSIKSTTTAPINVISADEVKIKVLENTYNEITDSRSSSITSEEASAIYSACDLKLVGKGNLVVYGNYNNGIQSKDDLKIKNVTLNVQALNNALKGNDSLEIESGNIIAVSTMGNGLKTENSDISSKGNQRGIISILGGILDIYSKEDGIDASYDVDIKDDGDDTTDLPIVNIYTDKYSQYQSSSVTDTSVLYLRIPSSYYSTNYRYSAYFYNNDGTYEWVNLSYYQSLTQQSGGQKNYTYYYYKLNMPQTSYKNVSFFRFNMTQSDNSLETYNAYSGGATINTSKNVFAITNISSNTITGDWTTYPTTTSSTESTSSSKGIKANNEVNIEAGNVIIKSTDDGIHANYGETLENGSTGLGNVNISGGSIYITSGDDGIHADNTLNINGGYVNVLNSYEGLEANQINISGGESYVYATDDGVNASKSLSTTPLITVSGGLLDVTVGSGDTDGIDSNGNYTQTGGTVITRCAATDNSGIMASIDLDGTFKMTGGTLITAGPSGVSTSNVNYVRFGSASSGMGMGGRPGFGSMGQSQSSSSTVTFTSGTYSVSNTNISFTLNQSYNNLLIISDELKTGQSYTLSGGTEKTWTQSSQAVQG